MQGFQQAVGELESLGARVAGISADTFASLGAFATQNGITFPLLSDWPELKTIEAFGVRSDRGPVAQRATFVFDRDGVCRAVVDDLQDMNAHSQGALEAVKELADG